MATPQSGKGAPDTRTIVIVFLCLGVLASAALAFRLLKKPRIRFETNEERAKERAASEGKLIVRYIHIEGTERSLAFERNVLAHPKIIAERDRFVWLEVAFDPNPSNPREQVLLAGVTQGARIAVFDAGMTRVVAWDHYAEQFTPERFLALLATAHAGPEAFEQFKAERAAERERWFYEDNPHLRER